MEMTDLFLGSAGRIFSSTCIMVILVMIFIVTIRLYVSRGKKAYKSFSISLIFIIIQYLLLIGLELWSQTSSLTLKHIAEMLQIIAFILINMGIYQLYNASKIKAYVYFYSFIAFAIGLSAIRFYTFHQEKNPSPSFILFHDIWSELYLVTLIFLCFYLISPYIGQRVKYQFGLTVYFIVQLSHIINVFILDQLEPVLSVTYHFLPIVYYIIVFIFIFDRVVELLQAIYKSSITDGLTGLYNRQYFLRQVTQYVKNQLKASVIFCDIDNFKKLNDTQGHQNGDEALKQVAAILIEESEEIGMAGRYGGEELVVLVTNPSVDIEKFAETIRMRIERETIVTVSVGCSKHRKGVHPADLIKQADQAMYQSKKSGKNRVTVYGEQVL
ncbi:MAG TPA: GGDEF domain-containing protein [Bacilli bacterium]